ncbi:MAG: hypothetical protein Q8P67_21950 [archaeon]|nr:hypothetical protein [archaeon]
MPSRDFLPQRPFRVSVPLLPDTAVDVVVILLDDHTLGWRPFRYASVGSLLRARYLGSLNETELQPFPLLEALEGPRVSVVLHVRAGDILQKKRPRLSATECVPSRQSNDKYLPASFYTHAIAWLLREGGLSERALEVVVVSEDPPSPQIAEISAFLRSRHPSLASRLRLHLGGPTTAAQAFYLMTHADVLVAGLSGFSRLAASMRGPGLVLAPRLDHHPLHALSFVQSVSCDSASGEWVAEQPSAQVSAILDRLVQRAAGLAPPARHSKHRAATNQRSHMDIRLPIE